jgi:hypothetical protein
MNEYISKMGRIAAKDSLKGLSDSIILQPERTGVDLAIMTGI